MNDSDTTASDRPTYALPIEITEAMIEAGESRLQDFFAWQLDDPDRTVCAVFQAMLAAWEPAKVAPLE